MIDQSAVLARCIKPVDVETFFHNYWEQKPLVVERNQLGYFSDLISSEAIDYILSSTDLRIPGFRLVREGSQLPYTAYTTDIPTVPTTFEDVAHLNRVYAEYYNGATIVLQALERSWGPLIEFCKTLELYLGHPVQANLYLTPANAQGFAAHYDTHDTLILQVEGNKRWKIYDSAYQLPLRKQKYMPDNIAHGEVIRDFVVHPGDAIYMPRGVVHEALTSETYSLHLTIGIKVWTWYDALSAVINDALQRCEQNVAFRKSLPLKFASGSGDRALEISNSFRTLLDQFQTSIDLDQVTELLSDKFVTSRWPYRKGQLLDLQHLDSVDLESEISPRASIVSRVTRRGDSVVLSFHRKEVILPAYTLEAVRFITSASRFRPSDIPGNLDAMGKITLVKRLIREGFLTLVGERNHS